ncbi:type I secretion protein TolC [Halopseudomonas bauzanensis]|nr:type I secretion protein TolC [Halopseudomonas bauzanensis]
MPPVSLAQHTTNASNTSNVDQASLALPLSVSGDAPARQDSVSFERLDLTDSDARSGTLRLADAVRSALNEHPAIAESLSRLDAQQEQVSVARAGYWPQLRGGINTGYRHTTGRSEEALTLSASQMLYDFGKVSSAVEAAASGVDREEASVLLAAEDLIRETTQAFIEARRYEELLELATAQIEAIGELEALAAKRSALGASSVSDQMQAQSRREAARAVQLQMQAQRDQWHSALEKLIGSSQRLTLDEAYPQPLEGLCPRLPENFDSAPRVVIAEAERAEAEAAIRQARAEQRPTLSLNADFEHYLNRNTEGLQQLDDQELVVSLNLTSNLFQGGALRARSRAAEHALQSASAARDRALLELSRFYREARDRSRSLTTSLALQDERYASIVKTQELYRHQYLSLGTRSLLDILNTEQEIFQTQVDKQNTLFDLRSLQIDCLYSVGGLRETFRAGEALNHRVSSRIAEVRS